MSSNGFIDIDSTYRNRNEWPNPGQFEIDIAQSGTKQKGNAEDPVSLAEPLAVWSCNALTTSQATTFQLYGEISAPNSYGNVGYNQDNTDLTLIFTDEYNNSIQEEENYYVGLILWNVTQETFSRIISYKYIGNNGTSPPEYSIALVTVADSNTFNFGDNFVITDDSDLSRPEYPLIFVPNGKTQDNAYLNYILYCENNNDYRDILYYKGKFKYVITEKWDGISDYQELGNFCIRKNPPLFPTKLETSKFVAPTSTTSVVNVNISGTSSLQIFTTSNQDAIVNKIDIPYKYDFLRVRPNRSINIPPSIVAVGDGFGSFPPPFAYSYNGIEWYNPANTIFSIGYAVANNGPNATTLRWVAGGLPNVSGGTVSLVYSTDAVIWTICATQPFTNGSGVGTCYSVFYDTVNTRWYAGGFNTIISIATSPDGNTWTDSTVTNPTPLQYVYAINKFSAFIVIGGKDASGVNTLKIGFYNIPSTTFTFNPVAPDPFTGGSGQCNGIGTDSSKWVAVGRAGTAGENIYYSTNSIGTTCAPSANNPFSGGGEGMCVSNNGDYWLVGGTTGVAPGYAQIAKSFDGVTWTNAITIPAGASSIRSIVWNGSYWIAVGQIGSSTPAWILTSVNGLEWTLTFNTIFDISYGISVYNENQNYDTYSGIYSLTNKSESRQIISYYNDGTTATFGVYPPFDIVFNNDIYAELEYTIEVLPFSYDNAVPFSYNGTLVQQNICYEFELLQLILPNFTLATGFGSKIAFYPYVYVELSNVSSTGSRLVNMMHSNNPNAVRMLFKVPIYDVQEPETTPFVRLVAIGMVHTMKFKPDDNLFFTVLLPNGDIFKTILPEYFSPSLPNSEAQVSAIFRYKAVI